MTEAGLRVASVADAPAIAALHVASWRAAYRDLAPAEVFEAMDEPLRLRRWSKTLSTPFDRQVVLLAEQDGRLAGMGMAASPSEAAFGERGEIRSLYLDPAFQRLGLGRRLMSALAVRIAGWGYSGAALGVVAGNDGAVAFYQALGGRLAGRYLDPGPLWRSENLIFAWDELSELGGGGRF